MLAGIAEFERELINARTGEGRARAKARGVRSAACCWRAPFTNSGISQSIMRQRAQEPQPASANRCDDAGGRRSRGTS